MQTIIFSSRDPERTKRFYQYLGVDFVREKHGSGPTHFGVFIEGAVLEIYPAHTHDENPEPIVLGLTISNIKEKLVDLRSLGGEVLREGVVQSDVFRAYVRDPDGRLLRITDRHR